jgi:hypothetical protein
MPDRAPRLENGRNHVEAGAGDLVHGKSIQSVGTNLMTCLGLHEVNPQILWDCRVAVGCCSAVAETQAEGSRSILLSVIKASSGRD